jgi:hypothetical protein
MATLKVSNGYIQALNGLGKIRGFGVLSERALKGQTK